MNVVAMNQWLEGGGSGFARGALLEDEVRSERSSDSIVVPLEF